MGLAIDIFFYAGTAFYLTAAMLVLAHLRGGNSRLLRSADRMLLAGALCLSAVLVFRWVAWRLLPLTNMTDALNLFAVLATVVMLVTARRHGVPALLCFYVPPLAALCLLNAMLDHGNLHVAPRALRGMPLMLHVGSAFWAYALFFLAGMTSAAYLFQARRLKRHRTGGLFQRLPSLDQLDGALCRLIAQGYVLFGLSLILGAVWVWADRDLLGPRWWLSPKIGVACVVVAFYGVTFHMRRLGRLRGPKLAYLVLFGFASVMLLYIVLTIAHLRTYNFWSISA